MTLSHVNEIHAKISCPHVHVQSAVKVECVTRMCSDEKVQQFFPHHKLRAETKLKQMIKFPI